MNSGPQQSPTAALSSPSPPNSRQRLTKDLSVTDLTGTPKKISAPSPLRSEKPIHNGGTPNTPRTKKLKDHFRRRQIEDENDSADADRDSVGNHTHTRSLDNSEQTAPTDNTTAHTRCVISKQTFQTVPTAKIIDDIIRTLEKSVQKRKKLEKRKKKKRKSTGINSDTETTPVEQLSRSLTDMENNSEKEKKRRGRNIKGKEKSKSLTHIEVPPADNNNSDVVVKPKFKEPSTPIPPPAIPDADQIQRVQRLKEKLAGSLERIEALIDQRLSNRGQKSLNLLQRSDSESINTIVSVDSSEVASTSSTSATCYKDRRGNAIDRFPNVPSGYEADLSTRSPHVPKKEQVTSFQDLPRRSPRTPNKNHAAVPREVCKESPKSERTPNQPPSTPSRVILPDVYKTYTVRTKGLPLTSPTPYARTPNSNNNKASSSCWKSPTPPNSNRTSEATPKGTPGSSSSSLANYLDDIQDLLLDDLYSVSSSIEDRSIYSMPLTMGQPPNKGKERSSSETHDNVVEEENAADMLTYYAWSATSNPSATVSHRKQARDTFWDDYRKSRLPITDRHQSGPKRSKNLPGGGERGSSSSSKSSSTLRQGGKGRGLHDELMLAKQSQPDKEEKKNESQSTNDFLQEIQHELRRRHCDLSK